MAATRSPIVRMVAPPTSLIATSIESPERPMTETGSKPPSKTAISNEPALPIRRIVARAPPTTLPGVKETYAMLSTAAAAAADANAPAPVPDATTPTAIGFETMRPLGGGGGGGDGGIGGVGPALSWHAPTHAMANTATHANAMIGRATVPSARTATPLLVSDMRPHRVPAVLTIPPGDILHLTARCPARRAWCVYSPRGRTGLRCRRSLRDVPSGSTAPSRQTTGSDRRPRTRC